MNFFLNERQGPTILQPHQSGSRFPRLSNKEPKVGFQFYFTFHFRAFHSLQRMELECKSWERMAKEGVPKQNINCWKKKKHLRGRRFGFSLSLSFPSFCKDKFYLTLPCVCDVTLFRSLFFLESTQEEETVLSIISPFLLVADQIEQCSISDTDMQGARLKLHYFIS